MCNGSNKLVIMSKYPWFKFWAQDWIADDKLAFLSPAAHGVLINIMAIMHTQKIYGKIKLHDRFSSEDEVVGFAKTISRMGHFESDEILNEIQSLIDSETLVIRHGFLVCERMVRDAEISAKRSRVGKTGGNPLLKQKVKQVVNQEVKHKESDTDTDKTPNISPTKKSFTKPEMLDVAKFLHYEKGLSKDVAKSVAEEFWSFYEMKDWKVGNSKMKNWKIAATRSLKWDSMKSIIKSNGQTGPVIKSNNGRTQRAG